MKHQPEAHNLSNEQAGNSGFSDDGKNTIGSQLASRLREAIISGDLEAGSKINLDRARQSFDVSLSPLREGLARLIYDGLVEFEDNRGYRVGDCQEFRVRAGRLNLSQPWPW